VDKPKSSKTSDSSNIFTHDYTYKTNNQHEYEREDIPKVYLKKNNIKLTNYTRKTNKQSTRIEGIIITIPTYNYAQH